MGPNESFSKQGQLVRQLIWLTRKHHHRCDALLENHGVGSGQVPILLTLARHESMTQRELAEHIHVTAATISGTLKRMERAGIISRTGREDDARISEVRLTDEGKALIAATRATFDQVDQELFGGFSEEDFTLLQGLIDRMQENLRKTLGPEADCHKHHGEKRHHR